MEKKQIVENKLVVVGGSAGGLEVILEILSNLKSPFNAIMLIVLHRGPSRDSLLVNLLKTKTNLPVREVDDKEPMLNGHIYLAPADYHVLIETTGYMSLDASEKINYSRPSIDVSFESAASFKNKTVAILLSGSNPDGTNGMITVKEQGGVCIVQDPATATVAFMPQSAIDKVSIDHIFTPKQIINYINNL